MQLAIQLGQKGCELPSEIDGQFTHFGLLCSMQFWKQYFCVALGSHFGSPTLLTYFSIWCGAMQNVGSDESLLSPNG